MEAWCQFWFLLFLLIQWGSRTISGINLDGCCRVRFLARVCHEREWYVLHERHFQTELASSINSFCEIWPHKCSIKSWNQANCSFYSCSIHAMPNYPLILDRCTMEMRIFVTHNDKCQLEDQNSRILRKSQLIEIFKKDLKRIESTTGLKVIYLEEIFPLQFTLLRQWSLQGGLFLVLALTGLTVFLKTKRQERKVLNDFFQRTERRCQKNASTLEKLRKTALVIKAEPAEMQSADEASSAAEEKQQSSSSGVKSNLLRIRDSIRIKKKLSLQFKPTWLEQDHGPKRKSSENSPSKSPNKQRTEKQRVMIFRQKSDIMLAQKMSRDRKMSLYRRYRQMERQGHSPILPWQWFSGGDSTGAA